MKEPRRTPEEARGHRMRPEQNQLGAGGIRHQAAVLNGKYPAVEPEIPKSGTRGGILATQWLPDGISVTGKLGRQLQSLQLARVNVCALHLSGRTACQERCQRQSGGERHAVTSHRA